MKLKLNAKRIACAALALLLVAGLAVTALATAIPAKAPVQSGVTVYQNAKATVDVSNLSSGFVSVKYTGGKDVRIKVQITKKGSDPYSYNLNNKGTVETFPLTEGDGEYTIGVFENTTETRYAQAYACTVTLALTSEFSPYLYPNQYVNYSDQSKVVAKAAELVKAAGAKTDLEKVTAVYHYVVNNISYDYDLAASVASGYLPDVDKILESGKGICFDYAAVMSAMLRSQNIPCKLVVGYAGKVYHAWINVYIEGIGWVDQLIYFDGKDWSLMDPTFVSSGKNDPAVLKYVGDGTNYSQKYAY